MRRYANRGGNSSVTEYEFGPSSITITFDDGSTYLYTNGSAGTQHIDEMKRLAVQGQGLNAYINTNVKHRYAKKLR